MKTNSLSHARADRITRQITPWLVGGLSGLIVGVPFHAFVVTILGAQFGHQLMWASWKEILLLLIAAGVIILAGWQSEWQWLKRGANRAIMIAILCGLLASVLGQGFGLSWLAGVKTTILPLILFVAVQPLSVHFTDRRLGQLILIPAVIVASLAIVQFFTTPTAFLLSIGYGAETIIPYQGVHPGFDVARSFSTLGGPNQLGVYLILPAIWLLSSVFVATRRDHRLLALGGFTIVLAGLVVSFSRSALLGLIIGLVVLIAMYVPKKWRVYVLGLSAMAAYLGWIYIASVIALPGTALSSFLLRGSVTGTGLVGGDSGHVNSIMSGIQQLMNHPLGLGIGSAGPASFYQDAPLLTENWWLQIGLELGIAGLIAMLASWYCMIRHWMTHLDRLDRVMVASFSGIAVSAMFLHVLADSTLALIVMTLAGLIYARHQAGHQPKGLV